MDARDANRPKPDPANEVPLKDLPAARRAAADTPNRATHSEDDELRIEDLPPRKNVTGG